jgi:hypothetical protein
LIFVQLGVAVIRVSVMCNDIAALGLIADDDGVQLHPNRKCRFDDCSVNFSFCNLQTLSTICKAHQGRSLFKVGRQRMTIEEWSGDGPAPCAMTTQRNATRLCQKMFVLFAIYKLFLQSAKVIIGRSLSKGLSSEDEQRGVER